VASGDKTCQDYYPIACDEGVESYDTCKVGLISCNKENNLYVLRSDRDQDEPEKTHTFFCRCPVMFNPSSTLDQDKAKGGAAFLLAMALMFLGMAGICYILQHLLFGSSTKVVHTVTSSCNGYISMLIGCGVTIFVQSSSLVTSMLVPIVGSFFALPMPIVRRSDGEPAAVPCCSVGNVCEVVLGDQPRTHCCSLCPHVDVHRRDRRHANSDRVPNNSRL
jgi:hypothetical protein